MITALLLLDLQNFFGSMLPNNKPCMNNILRLIETCRGQGHPIILTQHGHEMAAFEQTANDTPPKTNQLIRKWGTAGLAVRYSEDCSFVSPVAEVVEGMQQDSSSGPQGEQVEAGDDPPTTIWGPQQGTKDSNLVVFQKETYDAFIGSSLLKVLQDPGM